MAENHDEENGFWGHLWREALVALSLGWDLALPIFAGVLLGYLLDQWLGTGHVFTLGLLTLGVAIGYYNIARFIQRIDQRDRQEEERRQTEQQVDQGKSRSDRPESRG